MMEIRLTSGDYKGGILVYPWEVAGTPIQSCRKIHQ